ncbi:polysaccharide pyruvyl transferase family protein [Lysinibacillus sp. LZ02]|uniref:polysaccharide pyruvyl transferase family protein n=1 Tax=Lysinibacillus sp. LZ02 TaxID=3420668 RepID=UPI003D369410
MKIGIVGNYGNDNNGDESILYGLIEQVKQTFSVNSADITVFSNNTQQTSEQYGVKSYPLYYRKKSLYKTFFKTYRTNGKYVSELDLLIIGGGGILMDFYRREAHLFSTYAFMAKNSKTPYIIYGCGAGPLDTFSGKFMIRLMCSYAQNISVRDFESKQLLHEIGVKKNIDVIGDPAFTLYRPKQQYADKPKKVGLSAVPMYNANYWPSGDVEKYESYVTSMATNLDELIKHKNVDITFFATKYPQDVTVTKDIQQKMRYAEKTTIIDRNLKPDALIDVASQQDVVIGTRLHSLILATDSATPIIAISYHRKVQDFMKLINKEERCCSIEDITNKPNQLLQMYEAVETEWQHVVDTTKATSKHLHDEAMQGKQLMIKAVEGK